MQPNIPNVIRYVEIFRGGKKASKASKSIIQTIALWFFLFYIKVPALIVIPAMLIQSISLIALLVVDLLKVKDLIGLEFDKNNPKKDTDMLISMAKWSLIRTAVESSISSVVVIFTMIFARNATLLETIDSNQLYLIGFAFVVVNILSVLTTVWGYNLVKKISVDSDAEVMARYSQIKNVYESADVMSFIVIFLFISFLFKIPVGIVLFFAGFMILLSFIGIFQAKEVSNIKESYVKPDTTIKKYDNEKIEGLLFGISESFNSASRGRSANAVIITDKRLLMIQAPVFGGAQFKGGMDFQSFNWLYNQDEIRTKTEELIKEGGIEKLLEYAVKSVDISNIEKIRLANNIHIYRKNLVKLEYTCFDIKGLNEFKEKLSSMGVIFE